jgi:hypothetical protein
VFSVILYYCYFFEYVPDFSLHTNCDDLWLFIIKKVRWSNEKAELSVQKNKVVPLGLPGPVYFRLNKEKDYK